MIDGPTLKVLRDKADLTQAQLAKIVGLRAETLSRYENGKLGIPVRTQWAIEKALSEHKQQ